MGVLLSRSLVVLLYWGCELSSIGRCIGLVWGWVLVSGVLAEMLMWWWVWRLLSWIGVGGVFRVGGVLV